MLTVYLLVIFITNKFRMTFMNKMSPSTKPYGRPIFNIVEIKCNLLIIYVRINKQFVEFTRNIFNIFLFFTLYILEQLIEFCTDLY